MQQSEEWFRDRLGFATASCFSDVLAKGSGKTRQAYLRRVVEERLTGEKSPGFSSKHTERGTEQEPLARLAYEAETGNIVQEVGFIKHSTLRAGCSPDGLVDGDGGIEIKCVLPEFQWRIWKRGGYPKTHVPQVQGCMWVTGRKYWDFISYSPDLPEDLRLYVQRVERDGEYIAHLEDEVTRFLGEAEELFNLLKAD